MGEWVKKTVRDLVVEGIIERPTDGNHGEIHPKTSDFVDEGIPFIMASDLVNGRVDICGCAFISEGQARTLRKGFALTGDVLLSHKATMGRTAIVGKLPVPFIVLTPQVTYYRVKDGSQLCGPYLKAYFDGPDFQSLFEAWGQKGSTRAYMGITDQLNLPVVLPPIGEQRAIAHILGTLDDKIELNRRMNETLEQMARALFKSWFVDFDPVRAKAEGRDTGMPEHIADLFPDRLVDSELGEIPEGWEVVPLGHIAEQLRDQVNPLDSPTSLFAHYSIPAFDAGRLPSYELGASILSQKSWVPSDVILLSKLNPEIDRTWLVGSQVTESAVCSTEFMVLRPRPLHGCSYLYCLLRSESLRSQIEGLVTGTSKSHQRAQVGAVLQLPVLMSQSAEVAFNQATSPLLAEVSSLLRESQTLASFRDGLLPRLISGELRIADAERFVEVVT